MTPEKIDFVLDYLRDALRERCADGRHPGFLTSESLLALLLDKIHRWFTGGRDAGELVGLACDAILAIEGTFPEVPVTVDVPDIPEAMPEVHTNDVMAVVGERPIRTSAVAETLGVSHDRAFAMLSELAADGALLRTQARPALWAVAGPVASPDVVVDMRGGPGPHFTFEGEAPAVTDSLVTAERNP